MLWIYIAAAIFGGGFILPALLGSLDFDTDTDFEFDADTDFDLDMDADVDVDADHGGGLEAATGISEWISSLLTFRTLIFFSAFFGIVGIVLTVLDYTEPIPFASATGLGLLAGVVNARLMSYLKRSDMSSHLTEKEIAGSTARVVLPVAQQRRGRVEVDVAGQPQFMVALPFRPDAAEMSQGAQVVVIEVKEGTAYVAPLPSLDDGISR